MPEPTIKVTGRVDAVSREQNIRMSLDGGGPGGMEIIFCCNERGLSVTLWNPFANAWQVIDAELLQTTR